MAHRIQLHSATEMTFDRRHTATDPPTLRRKVTLPRRHLVFTSAGDHSNLHRWLSGRRNFDVWVCYYGDTRDRFADLADIYNRSRGSKFGNLKLAYDSWPEVLAPYRAVLVLDDDVLISATEISRLFDLQAERDLWVLQPAFSPLGKISWDVTRAQWSCSLRFTNFVEMTCPLFRKDKLDAFMAVFDPALASVGTDMWYMQALGPQINGKVAVVDAVTCINPFDRTKGHAREIDHLMPAAQREHSWQLIQEKYHIEKRRPREFAKVLKPRPTRWVSPLVHWPIDVYAAARRRASAVKRFIAR